MPKDRLKSGSSFEAEELKNVLRDFISESNLFQKSIQQRQKKLELTDMGYGRVSSHTEWSERQLSRYEEVGSPNVSVIFYIRSVVEALSLGSMTEKELKAAVQESCKELGVKTTGRGSVAGTNIDISTICGILRGIGVLEPDLGANSFIHSRDDLVYCRKAFLAERESSADKGDIGTPSLRNDNHLINHQTEIVVDSSLGTMTSSQGNSAIVPAKPGSFERVSSSSDCKSPKMDATDNAQPQSEESSCMEAQETSDYQKFETSSEVQGGLGLKEIESHIDGDRDYGRVELIGTSDMSLGISERTSEIDASTIDSIIYSPDPSSSLLTTTASVHGEEVDLVGVNTFTVGQPCDDSLLATKSQSLFEAEGDALPAGIGRSLFMSISLRWSESLEAYLSDARHAATVTSSSGNLIGGNSVAASGMVSVSSSSASNAASKEKQINVTAGVGRKRRSSELSNGDNIRGNVEVVTASDPHDALQHAAVVGGNIADNRSDISFPRSMQDTASSSCPVVVGDSSGLDASLAGMDSSDVVSCTLMDINVAPSIEIKLEADSLGVSFADEAVSRTSSDLDAISAVQLSLDDCPENSSLGQQHASSGQTSPKPNCKKEDNEKSSEKKGHSVTFSSPVVSTKAQFSDSPFLSMLYSITTAATASSPSSSASRRGSGCTGVSSSDASQLTAVEAEEREESSCSSLAPLPESSDSSLAPPSQQQTPPLVSEFAELAECLAADSDTEPKAENDDVTAGVTATATAAAVAATEDSQSPTSQKFASSFVSEAPLTDPKLDKSESVENADTTHTLAQSHCNTLTPTDKADEALASDESTLNPNRSGNYMSSGASSCSGDSIGSVNLTHISGGGGSSSSSARTDDIDSENSSMVLVEKEEEESLQPAAAATVVESPVASSGSPICHSSHSLRAVMGGIPHIANAEIDGEVDLEADDEMATVADAENGNASEVVEMIDASAESAAASADAVLIQLDSAKTMVISDAADAATTTAEDESCESVESGSAVPVVTEAGAEAGPPVKVRAKPWSRRAARIAAEAALKAGSVADGSSASQSGIGEAESGGYNDLGGGAVVAGVRWASTNSYNDGSQRGGKSKSSMNALAVLDNRGGDKMRITKRGATQRAWRLVDGIDLSILLDPSSVLEGWAKACYDEAVALEIEEGILRRLAGQCKLSVPRGAVRVGTAYLSQEMENESRNPKKRHIPSFRNGGQYTAALLWEKAHRKRAKKGHGSSGGAGNFSPKDIPPFYTSVQNAMGGAVEMGSNESSASTGSAARGKTGKKSGNISVGPSSSSHSGTGGGSQFFPMSMKHYVPPLELKYPEATALLCSTGAMPAMDHSAAVYLPDLTIATCYVPWRSLAREFMPLEEDGDQLSPRTSSGSSSWLSAPNAETNELACLGSSSSSSSSSRQASSMNRGAIDDGAAVDSTHSRKRTRMSLDSSAAAAGGGGGGGGAVSASRDSSGASHSGRGRRDSSGGSSPRARTSSFSSVHSLLGQVVLAPQVREIEPITADRGESDDESGEEEDISDEAVLARHEATLKKMRDRWALLQQLKQEQKDSLSGAAGGISSNAGGHGGAGSPRGSSRAGPGVRGLSAGGVEVSNSTSSPRGSTIPKKNGVARRGGYARRRGRPPKPNKYLGQSDRARLLDGQIAEGAMEDDDDDDAAADAAERQDSFSSLDAGLLPEGSLAELGFNDSFETVDAEELDLDLDMGLKGDGVETDGCGPKSGD